MPHSIAPFIDNAGTVFSALSFLISVQAHMVHNSFVEVQCSSQFLHRYIVHLLNSIGLEFMGK